MPSPFPGLDPYLEDDKHWPDFNHQLIACLYQILLPGLVDRYKARMDHRRYVTEHALFISVVREQHAEDFIEIRHRTENRLVTVVEMATPANKTTPEGRKSLLDKRAQSKAVGANFVEIDLVLQGQPLLAFTRAGHVDWDYAVTVTRATHPERFEVYSGNLQKPLPRFKLPMAGDDRDTLVDLQTAFTRCFDQCGFPAKINYQRNPPATLRDDYRQWVHDLLKQKKLR
jgi:hypothetical protein